VCAESAAFTRTRQPDGEPPALWNVTRAAPDVGELREDEHVVELDLARARLTAIREPMALDLNAGRVFLSHSVQGRPVFGLKPDAAVVGPVQASTVGPLQVTTPTREKSLTGSMYLINDAVGSAVTGGRGPRAGNDGLSRPVEGAPPSAG
jgi:hypothetical protein